MASAERTRKIDVIGKAESHVIPALLDLFEIDKQDSLSPGGRDKLRFSVVRKKLIKPVWGKTMPLEEMRDNQVVFDRNAVVGSKILTCTTDATVRNSLVVGDMVLAVGTGANFDGFSSKHFENLIDLAEGIRSESEGKVMKALTGLTNQLNPYERDIRGKISSAEDKSPYKKFGPNASAAKIVDEYYFPFLKGETTARTPTVDNTIIYASHFAFDHVLGGKINDAVIASASPLRHAHIRVETSYFLSGDGVQVIEKGRYGDPDRAEEAIAAVRDLPPSKRQLKFL